MKFKQAIGLIILSLPLTVSLKAQMKEGYKAEIEVQAIGTTNGTVPFWMRSNQFGSIPLSGLSGSVIGRLSKDYSEASTSDQLYGRKRIFDWGFGFEGRANGGKNSNLQLIEGYAKAKAWIFQLKVGRSKDVMGLNGDTSLSSGNFALSGNALGIPKFEISIPDYWSVPLFDGLFSVKGNFVHGLLGRIKIIDSISYTQGQPPQVTINNMPKTYFHQKSLYIKLGKPDWRLKLYGGFSHQVMWGNEQAAYGDNFDLSPSQAFVYVVTGKAYGKYGIPSSKIGNQLGSIDLGIEYDLNDVKILLYRQNFYDVGALAKLANISDGLNGISIKNKNVMNNEGHFWKSFVFEVFSSKNQAGYPWSKPTKSGDEDYYNNYYYRKGWSYYGQGLGNPFITLKKDARTGQASLRNDYFINNRVFALHTGASGSVAYWEYNTKVSYSWNYGTFGTSEFGKSTGSDRGLYVDPNNIFIPVQQLSIYFDAMRTLDNGYKVGFSTGADYGRLLNNSFGIQLKVLKSFNK